MRPAHATAGRLVFIAICCGLIGSGSLAALPPVTGEHLIDAGSYHLFFRVIRGEGPVVLLESGGGMDSSEWEVLAPRIAAATGATIVTYDRAGFGKSDLPDLPYDMREESASLWRALAKLGLDGNVVLAGHSYGGWMIRLHAHDHPDRVAGLVFIDPFNCEFVEALGIAYCDRHPMMGPGALKDIPAADLTREQQAMLRMTGDGLGPKVALMKETRIPAGIPVRLISSRQPFLPETKEQEAWWRSHEVVTAAIPGAVLVEAAESGHMVPWQQPELVIESIQDVLAAAARP